MSTWKLGTGRWGSGASEVDDIAIDAVTNALITVQNEHHEVHEGSAFSANHVDTSMAIGDTNELCFKTPAAGKLIHLAGEFLTLTGGHLDLIEGPTWDASSGSAVAIYNRKRAAAMTSSVLLEDRSTGSFVANDELILNPTTFAGGTVLLPFYGFGQKNQFSGGGQSALEWVLQPETQYAVRFVSTANSNAAQILMRWYEHTSKH